MKKSKSSKKNQTSYFPRHLARSVAKANMKRAGIQRINRSFSLNWRNYVAN